MHRFLIPCLPRPLTCVFGRFAMHGPRMGTPLPSILWLSRVALIRGLSWTRIWTCRTHWTGRVIGITWGRLHHVHLWGVSLRWHLARVAGSSGSAALVRRGLVKIHVWVKSSPKKNRCKGGRDKSFHAFWSHRKHKKMILNCTFSFSAASWKEQRSRLRQLFLSFPQWELLLSSLVRKCYKFVITSKG